MNTTEEGPREYTREDRAQALLAGGEDARRMYDQELTRQRSQIEAMDQRRSTPRTHRQHSMRRDRSMTRTLCYVGLAAEAVFFIARAIIRPLDASGIVGLVGAVMVVVGLVALLIPRRNGPGDGSGFVSPRRAEGDRHDL